MSHFVLRIETDNAAFSIEDEHVPEAEVARILDDLGRKFTSEYISGRPIKSGTVKDGNGNRVGHWVFE